MGREVRRGKRGGSRRKEVEAKEEENKRREKRIQGLKRGERRNRDGKARGG